MIAHAIVHVVVIANLYKSDLAAENSVIYATQTYHLS